MHHVLKTDSRVFQPMEEGLKNFEIRYNDRNFTAGDTLTLKETRYSGEEMKDVSEGGEGKPLEYTGEELEREVHYVLHGGIYGLKEGWVILQV